MPFFNIWRRRGQVPSGVFTQRPVDVCMGAVVGVQGVEPAGALRVAGFGGICILGKGGVHKALGRRVILSVIDLRARDGQRVRGLLSEFGGGRWKPALSGDAVQLHVVRVRQNVSIPAINLEVVALALIVFAVLPAPQEPVVIAPHLPMVVFAWDNEVDS